MGQVSLNAGRDHTVYGGYVLTQHGRFYLDCSTPKTIRLSDIAIANSRKGRWSDLGRRQLTVGEHTIYVSYLAEAIAYFDGHNRTIQLLCAFHGLHHDDHEAYPPGELPTPCKKILEGAEEMGNDIQDVIYEHFDWPDMSDLVAKIVKEADGIAAFKEGPVLFQHHPDTANIGITPRHPDLDHLVPYEEPCRREVLINWLARHRELETALGFDLAE